MMAYYQVYYQCSLDETWRSSNFHPVAQQMDGKDFLELTSDPRPFYCVHIKMDINAWQLNQKLRKSLGIIGFNFIIYY